MTLLTGFGLLLLAAADAAPPADQPSAGRPSPPPFLPSVRNSLAQPEPRAYPLRRSGEGYEYSDSRFTARVAPDGAVTFSDKRLPTKLHLIPLFPRAHPPGTPTLESSLRDVLGRRRAPVPPPELVPPPVDPEPTRVYTPISRRDPERENPTYPDTPIWIWMISGRFDLTDEYYRAMGNDPYRHEKARFLAATFDFRLRLAVQHQIATLRRALHAFPDTLQQLWDDRTRPAVERKRLLCALWSELRRDDDAAPVAAQIRTFVRQKIPIDSPDAFTADELAACNATLPPEDRFFPYEP
jgi:hypothetical protein